MMERNVIYCIVLTSMIYPWNLRVSCAQADWSWSDMDSTSHGGFPMRSEMACEDYPIIIRCPGHDVIQIIAARYGRQNRDKCSASTSETENTNCALPEAKSIVAEKCNNQTHCTFHVSGNNFPDPCPGTKKYLETRFNCVRYMFTCPGSLTGIGQETVSTIDVKPEPGTWTKDPFFNTNHVFFAPYGKTVNEYSSWEDFENGNSLTRYTLSYNMAPGNIIVNDRRLYYIKKNSRIIVKYSLIAKSQTNERTIPGPRGRGGALGNDMSISADAQGLWVVYTRGNGVITLGKLDKDRLSLLKTWTIRRHLVESKYSFFICGVFYSVNFNTGKVDYSYNTNANLIEEKRGLHVEFDITTPEEEPPDSRRKIRRKTFLGYDTDSLTYNPRDQLLYLWDAKNGNAVYFKLHFDGIYPGKVIPPSSTSTTTTLTTTPTTRKTTITTTTTTTTPEQETTGYDTVSEFMPPDTYRPEYCPPIVRNNLDWPMTRVGDNAILQCLDGHGDFATWKCVREPSMLEPEWHIAGPDLTNCIIWASDIGAHYKSGLIDRAIAFQSLASKIVEADQLNSKSIEATAKLISKLFEDATLPSQENAKKIAECMADISSSILRNEEAMSSLNAEGQSKIAETLLNSTEKAGFIYAETLALTPAASRDQGPLIIESDDVLMQVEVIEKTYSGLMSPGVTSFPDERTCASTEFCGSDIISIHDADILGQKGEGPAIVVFSLHANLGEYLSPAASQWKVDSNVISATFEEPNYRATLNQPARITLKHNSTSRSSHRCVFWDHSDSSKPGNWSDDGCRLVKANYTHTTCECDHLTSFAILVNHQGVEMEPYHDARLDIITKVGISISIVCLIVCVLTFACFRNLYNDRNTVHKNLCICLLIAEAVFLLGIDKTGNQITCSVVAGLLHYFFLAAFVWMALEGFQLYVMLVEVFEESSRLKWYYLAGYGIPAAVVGVSAAVDHTGYGTEEVCWLAIDSGFIWSFVGPILVIILVNLGFLAMTVYKMYVHTMAFTDSGKISSIKASVRGASVLLCLLGITWAFGILWISEDMAVLAYLFCIFNAFQGMFIFIFYCLLPKKVRQEYARFFSQLPCCQELGRDSYVANSSSFQKQYTRGGFRASANDAVVQQGGQQSQLRRMWNETVAPRNSESAPITLETDPDRVSTLSKELSRREQNLSGSIIPYFYTVKRKLPCPPSFGGTEPRRSRRRQPSILSSHARRSTTIFSDPASPPDTFSRDVSHSNHMTVDQRSYLQEDEVFLPPDNGQGNVDALNSGVDELHYDRLQHHHHPDDYLVFSGNARAMGCFHTGQIPKSSPRHSGARQFDDHLTGTSYGHFGPKSISHSQVQEMLFHQEAGAYQKHNRNLREVNSNAWDCSRVQHPRSLDGNLRGKRDSGISLQRPSSNSRILEHPLADRQGRAAPYRRSFDNTLGERRPDSDEFTHHVQGRSTSSKRNSMDIGDCQNTRNNKHRGSATLDPSSVTYCPKHNSMVIPHMGTRPKGTALTNGHKRRKSLSSDSDDPIVTDCSVSSAGSSFGNQVVPLMPTHKYDSSYYEEPICHRRRLPDPAHGKHLNQWHNRSDISDQNQDENDLEVELITSSDNSIEAEKGTLGYPPYRPPSVPKSVEEALVAVPAGSRVAVADISAYPAQGVAITQHNDIYGRPSSTEILAKLSPKHASERESNGIVDVSGRTVSNL